jgi:hypothetical protein
LSGLEVDDSIIQSNRPQRTGSPSGYKIAARVEFTGIVQPGDDFITQGGTFADLRDFIAMNGGRIVAATTLAAAPSVRGIDPLQLAVLPENLVALEKKFGILSLENLLSKYGIHSGHAVALANSEATWFLRFPSAEHADQAIQRDLEHTNRRRAGRSAH